MPALERGLFYLALLLYAGASACAHLHLFLGSERAHRLSGPLLWATFGTHFAALGLWCLVHEHPIVRDPGMPFSMVAFFLAAGQLALTTKRGWSTLGAISMPTAFLAQFAAAMRRADGAQAWQAASPLLSPHVMAVVLGFAAFALSFCLALIYLVQSRLLKRKLVKGPFERLPPLEGLSSGAHWMAVIGFTLLTLGIVTGVVAAPERWGGRWYLDPRTVSTLVAWAVYAAYLGLNLGMGWRGRRTTWFLIAGFVAVSVAFAASIGRPKGATTSGGVSRAPGETGTVRPSLPAG